MYKDIEAYIRTCGSLSKNERCEVYESNCSSTSYPCATGSLEAGTAKLNMLIINARKHTSDTLSNLIGRN